MSTLLQTHVAPKRAEKSHTVSGKDAPLERRNRMKPLWRKAARVELTRECLTPPTGFEVQPYHRIRMPSAEKKKRRDAPTDNRPTITYA